MVMRVRLHFSICCPVLFAAVTFFAAASSQAAEPLAFRRAIDLALRHSTTMAIATADQVRAHSAVVAGRNLVMPRGEIGSGAGGTHGYPVRIEGPGAHNFNVTKQQVFFN